MKYKYSHIALGGTFDRLHTGHKKIIDLAFSSSKKVTVGITSDEMNLGKYLSGQIEPFFQRKKSVISYLMKNNYLDRAEIITLKDIYGTTLVDSTFDSIAVTTETLPGSLLINEKRLVKGLSALSVVECEMVRGVRGQIIHSTSIRRSLTNTVGEPYLEYFSSDLQLPDDLRNSLGKPLKTPIFVKNIQDTAKYIVELLNQEQASYVVSIGDVITDSLLKIRFTPQLIIIDNKTRRNHILTGQIQIPADSVQAKSKNPAGIIGKDAVKKLLLLLETSLSKKTKSCLVIDGEEDLLTLPSILLAPLGSYILYGQYDQGVVVVKVTTKIKNKIENIIKQFVKI